MHLSRNICLCVRKSPGNCCRGHAKLLQTRLKAKYTHHHYMEVVSKASKPSSQDYPQVKSVLSLKQVAEKLARAHTY